MQSGNQNIVEIRFSVTWRISDPKDYLFNVADPEGLVQRVADTAMREIVGRPTAEDVRTDRRAVVETAVHRLIQTHGLGVYLDLRAGSRVHACGSAVSFG